MGYEEFDCIYFPIVWYPMTGKKTKADKLESLQTGDRSLIVDV
jgi:hypothetical protein